MNRIQNLRKSKGFEITDKINITLSKNEAINEAVKENKAYICNQVLGESLEVVDNVENGDALDFEDYVLSIKVIKA